MILSGTCPERVLGVVSRLLLKLPPDFNDRAVAEGWGERDHHEWGVLRASLEELGEVEAAQFACSHLGAAQVAIPDRPCEASVCRPLRLKHST
jgi:hypothetical protein